MGLISILFTNQTVKSRRSRDSNPRDCWDGRKNARMLPLCYPIPSSLHTYSASAPCFTVSFGNTLLGLFSLSLSLFLCNFLSYTFLFLLIFNSISALVDYRNFSISIFEFWMARALRENGCLATNEKKLQSQDEKPLTVDRLLAGESFPGWKRARFARQFIFSCIKMLQASILDK